MSSTRRPFLRGLASAAGVATAGTAYAQQHVHPETAPAGSSRAPLTVPAGKLGAGVIPVVTPDVPDMPWRLENGIEIFYIIENGVRLTGMPAWGTGEASGESASWMLVHFIRHLPEVSDAELEAMARLNPVPPDEVRQRMREEQFLESDTEPPVAPSPQASPHKH